MEIFNLVICTTKQSIIYYSIGGCGKVLSRTLNYHGGGAGEAHASGGGAFGCEGNSINK